MRKQNTLFPLVIALFFLVSCGILPMQATPTEGMDSSLEPLLPTPTTLALLNVAQTVVATSSPTTVAPQASVTVIPELFVTPDEALTPLPPAISSPTPIAPQASATVVRESFATPSEMATLLPTITLRPEGALSAEFSRFGAAGGVSTAHAAYEQGLRFAQLLPYQFDPQAVPPPDTTLWWLVRLREEGIFTPISDIEKVARTRPHSHWVIANEPDVRWQDNVTPARLAELYHEAYTLIKGIDPTAQIGFGNVAAGTPLRLRYLDEVLASYQARYGVPLSADFMTVHGYILREERNSWGIDVPPGESADTGMLYETEQHADLTLFRDNLLSFRRWMATNGYQNLPLALTEFGILFPHDYGYPPATVAQYLRDTFDILLRLEDASGLPSDNGRVIQQFFWYILEDDPNYYPTGDLYSSEEGELTLVGRAYLDYIQPYLPR